MNIFLSAVRHAAGGKVLMTYGLAFLSIFCAVIPILTFLVLIWWMDRYDREPIWLVGLTFIWGSVGAVLFALIASTIAMVPLTMVMGDTLASQTGAVFIAPLCEEPTKALILFLIIFSRHFDNTTDGFVYGATAGLGFGMTENFLYFLGVAMTGDPAMWVVTVVIRTFFSALMHAGATSIVGAALGFVQYRGFLTKIFVVPLGFILAMTMHGIWNGLITADEAFNTNGVLFGMDLVLFPFEVLTIFLVFQFCLWDERSTIKRELKEEAENGLLPAAHVPILASYFRRFGRSWLAKGVPYTAYVKTATTLAFRKNQARSTKGSRHAFYEKEVERHRASLQDLLARAEA